MVFGVTAFSIPNDWNLGDEEESMGELPAVSGSSLLCGEAVLLDTGRKPGAVNFSRKPAGEAWIVGSDP